MLTISERKALHEANSKVANVGRTYPRPCCAVPVDAPRKRDSFLIRAWLFWFELRHR